MTWVAIGDLVTPVRRAGPDRSRPTFTYIDLSSLDAKSKTIEESSEIPTDDAPSRARQNLEAGDVLVSTVRPNLNGVATVPAALGQSIGSTGFSVLRPRPELLDGRYLFHWVRTEQFVEVMTRLATGASYPAVSDAIVKGSLLPLPPLPEQRRIAAILDEADAIRQLRIKSGFDTTSVFRLRLRDELDVLPRRGTVSDYGAVQLGRQRAPKYQSGTSLTPYLRVANVHLDHLKLDDVLQMDFNESDRATYGLADGDILLNEGQSTELVGRPAIWRNEIPGCCFQNTLVRFRANRDVQPEYALSVFLHWFWTGALQRISSKTSNIAHLGAARFARMPFPHAGAHEMDRIAATYREYASTRAHREDQLTRLDSLFASLQHRAFRGEL
ncbi:MAG: restriction modification system specificity domain protein [Microbacterium sp.]|nr:restriction modification system specificity domain protein [Microbacterium sp.]